MERTGVVKKITTGAASRLPNRERCSNNQPEKNDPVQEFWNKIPVCIEQDIDKKVDLLLNIKNDQTKISQQQDRFLSSLRSISDQFRTANTEQELNSLLSDIFTVLPGIDFILFSIDEGKQSVSITDSSFDYFNNKSKSLNYQNHHVLPVPSTSMLTMMTNKLISTTSFLEEIFQTNKIKEFLKQHPIKHAHCFLLPIDLQHQKNRILAISTSFLLTHHHINCFQQLASKYTFALNRLYQLSHFQYEQTEEEKIENTAHEELIINLSHDIRNTINPIINLLPILLTSDTGSKQEKIIEVIENNLHHIQTLVSNVKELATLKSSHSYSSEKRFSLAKEIMSGIEKHHDTIDKKQLDLIYHLDEDICIKANQSQIQTVISHLLQNAIQYTSTGDTIEITVEKNDEYIHLSVSDTGVGMNRYQIDQAFVALYKADPSRHRLHHHGLGLTICKHIIEKHQGSIWIESQGIKKGSTVHVLFPLSRYKTRLYNC